MRTKHTSQKEKQYTLRPGVYIYLRGNFWMLRYRVPVEAHGKRKWVDQYKKLAHRTEFESPRGVEHLARPYVDNLPDKMTTATTQTIAHFIQRTYLPFVESDSGLAASTVNGYRHLFARHLKHRLANTRLCDFRTATGQQLLERICHEEGLSQNSLKNIKWFMVAALNHAKRVDALQSDGNPMEYTKVPAKAKEMSETAFYSLDAINRMLEALADEPVASAVVATAAFTGLRRSELRGLRWEDLRDNQLFVTRTVWNTQERSKTKTPHSKAPVPVLPVLAKLLKAYRNGFPKDGYIFAGPKMSKPLNLANLARRVIVPKLRAAGVESWCGWHGFRRGLATNLYELGVAEETIQAILRHADIGVTRRHYIKKVVVPEASRKAMKRLESVFTRMQKRNRGLRNLGTGVGTPSRRRLGLGTGVGTPKRRKSLKPA